MKQYPRISRLSTVGLRQHQAFDYDFHPFRTDFIGESGSGKSMIADLLQLILVGSEQFSSATEALGGKRLPDGMVLKTKDRRGTDVGYAFLTIEVEYEKYTVIGTYIESSARNTTAFVIQAGYEEDEMTPLSSKLSFRDLLQEEKILPLNELKPYLESKGMICHSYFHKKNYYKYLYRNRLLSIDLSVSEKILRDYANIIQSFSRGKSIDTQRGDALKQFLFGDELAKELLNRYQVSVKEMQAGFNEYGQNLIEIDLITRKLRTISKLVLDEKQMNVLHVDWLYTRWIYSFQQESRIRGVLKEALTDTLGANNALLTLKKVIDEDYQAESNRKALLDEREIKYKSERNRILPSFNRVEKVKNLLSTSRQSLEELIERHTRGRFISALKVNYIRIEQQLRALGLDQYFTSIWENKDKAALIDFLDQEKESIGKTLQEKISFRQFVDINSKGSLGYWALQQKRSFGLEEESVIMHYKTLSTRRPISFAGDIVRYLPDAAGFLGKISIVDPDDNGFWLSLNGLKEYIPNVREQLFTTEKLESLAVFFEKWTKDLETDIEKLESSIGQVEKMKKVIIQESDFDRFLEALRYKKEVVDYIADELTKMSEEEFEQSIVAYRDATAITMAYDDADKAYEECYKEKIDLDNYVKAIERSRQKIDKSTDANEWMTLARNLRQALGADDIRLIEDDAALAHYFSDQLHSSTDKASYLSDRINDYIGRMRSFDLKRLYPDWEQSQKNKHQAGEEYGKILQRAPVDPAIDADPAGKGDDKKVHYELSKAAFEKTYADAVHEFIPSDAHKFKNSFDCAELGMAFLPAAFQGRATSDNVIESIANYLNKINDSNKELNKRKLQKIRDLLDDVSAAVSSRLTAAKRIDNFLDQKDKEITGGHRVRLKTELSREYPKDWISQFQYRLDNDAHTLISDEVAQGVSLEEKMIAAFKACTDGATGKPKIEKLLDPNAYLEVSFSMESSSGQLNKGSAGQSYAGLALLCIARLSIIGAREDRTNPPGIRFMPIDEAEGLGSNYDMLYNIAKAYDYQIISLSINPLGKFQDGDQYIYMLHKNTESGEDVNYQPYAIFCDEDKKSELLYADGDSL